MNRKPMLLVALTAGLLTIFFLSFTFSAANNRTAHGADAVVDPCPIGDVDCDGRINIVDIQSIAALAGTPQGSEPYRPELDFDENGLIDLDDIFILRPAWRLPPTPTPISGTTGLDGGPPRLGYAVDINGDVFLRWQLPVSPYSATVEVLRQPAPAGALPTARPGVGVIAAVDPITDDATALPLLGDNWSYLSGVFSSTLDAEGVRVPVTLTSVAEMHQYIQEETNSFVVQAVSNQDAGVAQVLGKGYWDSDFSATGVYTYWVRVNGRIVGPVRVDTTGPTELPAPEDVTAFEGTVNVPNSGYGSLTLQNMKRGAHATIFLRWNPELSRRQNHPQWQNGFNVWRQTCITPGNCTAAVKVNDEPVFPKVTAAETLETETITNSLGISVTTGNEIHDFTWFWSDSDLRTDRLYCYRVAALDLLQQEGKLSGIPADNSHCLRPPDYLPPETVEILDVRATEPTEFVGPEVEIVIATLPDDERNGDTLQYRLYRARRATAPWPAGWEQVDILSPDGVRPTWTLRDGQVEEHEEFWYRVVALDSSGNQSIPGAPVIARVDDTIPPSRPSICIGLPGQTLTRPCFTTPDDTAFLRIYRRFSPTGTPLLIDRVPVDEWPTWTDDYAPLRATQVFYEAIAEDEAGNLSDVSLQNSWTLSAGEIQTVSTPVISETKIITGAGGEYNGVVTWQMVGTQNLARFTIYRDDGAERPTDTSTMMEVGELTVQGRGVANVATSYTFTDTSSGIGVDELVWYIVEASPLIGPAKPSSAYPARFVNLDDLGERPMSSFEVRRAAWNANKDQVEIELFDRTDCCYILFRSRDGVNDFAQITPIVAGSSFVDQDVRPGDSAYYQILQIDGGTVNYNNKTIEPASASGEILAYTTVFQVAIPDDPALPPLEPVPPIPQQSLPPNAPAFLQFGANWTVQVRDYSATTLLGGGTARVSGDAAVQLSVSPTTTRPVRVTFSNVIINSAGVVQGIDAGGNAIVHVNVLPVIYPDRWRYALEDMYLTEVGAFADLVIFNVESDLKHWLINPSGPGTHIPIPGADVPIDGPDLSFSRTVNGSQNCASDPTTLFFPFAVTDWPLLIVPTDSFTITHQGVDFSATCTLYRDRFVNENVLGDTMLGVLDYRNDGFLRESYTSGPVSYRMDGGLDGSWARNAAHSYHAAFPFRFIVEAQAWRFHFADGRLINGNAETGTLFFNYRGGGGGLRVFNATFDELTLNGNGAFTGTVQTTDRVRWTQFALEAADHKLYLPAALSPRVPRRSWSVGAGKTASGIPGDGTWEPGLNAQQHDLTWTVCPASTPNEIVFPAGSGAQDLYVRRSGVSGVADYALVPPTEMSLAGYATELTRFGLSWFDNVEMDSAVAGSIYLPYPADITLRFDALTLINGCVEQGQVLPDEQVLDYWNMGITPWVATLKETSAGSGVFKLWLWSSAEVNHLRRVDGVGADLELDLPFNPDGTFCDTCDGEIIPQDAVYAVDEFYVILKDLRLSDYPSSETPPWNPAITIEDPPTVSEGFIELTAGAYLPMFGEVSDPNSARVILLGDQEYIGFADQPVAEQPLSEKLDIDLSFRLVYAQGQGNTDSRWISAGTSRLMKVGGETIAEIPQGLVVEPNLGRIVVGFPGMSALFLAADEAYASWPGRAPATAGNAAARFDGWRDELGLSTPILDFESELGAFFVGAGMTDYGGLISAIDAEVSANYDGEVDQWITDGDLDLVHYQFPLLSDIMDNSPTQIKWARGDAAIKPVRDQDGRMVDGTLDRLEAATRLKVYTNPRTAGTGSDAAQSPLLQSDLTMIFDAQGWISLEADGIKGGLLEEQLEMGSLDVDLRLLFSESLGYGVEGGLTLYDLKTDLADINKAGAVAGFTLDKPTSAINLLYVGAFLDVNLDVAVIGRINVGGSMLFGRLDSDSPILQAEYGDLFDDMNANGIIEGAYVMVYANNIPIFQVGSGCLGIEIKGGGEVAFWVFTQDGTADTAWGTRLGVNAMGEAFCIASAKADITLTLSNDFGQDNLDLTGKAWAGAGCGSCEPEEWETKNDVYNDKWCLKCVIDLYFVIPLANSTTKSDFTFDADCPF